MTIFTAQRKGLCNACTQARHVRLSRNYSITHGSERSIVMNVSVCICVCLSVCRPSRISREPHQISLRKIVYSGSAGRWYDRIANKEVLQCTGQDTLSHFLSTRHSLLPSSDMSPDWANPRRRTWLFDVTRTNHIPDFLVVHGVALRLRYDTRCYFNVRSKADISQLNLPHGTDN